MTTAQIKAAIQAWAAITHNGSAMLTQFQQGNSFNFTMPAYATGTPSMHVYLGIVGGQLTFFSIPSKYDNAQTANIQNYVIVSDAIWTLQGGGRIPSPEAAARIDRWQDHYQTWVPARAATTNGVFQAFDIPIEDYEGADSSLILGLKLDSAGTHGKAADMIVKNVSGGNAYYDDFVKSVPPYGAATLQTDFYLGL